MLTFDLNAGLFLSLNNDDDDDDDDDDADDDDDNDNNKGKRCAEVNRHFILALSLLSGSPGSPRGFVCVTWLSSKILVVSQLHLIESNWLS